MSGSIGANRIPRSAVEATFKAYIEKVLKKFPGFKSAKISGSYNTTVKPDHGDLDLVINIEGDEQDKKKLKQQFAAFINSLPDDISVPFKSGRYAGKKSAGTGDIVIVGFPIEGFPGLSVQIDNMIVTSEQESDYRKSFLDLPAEKQGLLVGLAKAILLEEDPQAIFSRLGISLIPKLDDNQELEFNLSNKGLTLRLVTLGDNFKEIGRNEIWTSFNWNDVEKLFQNYNLKGDWEDLLNDIKSKLKNPRSKNRVKGVFNSLVVINAGEAGTPKGDNKLAAKAKVDSTLTEHMTNLGQYLANIILEAEDQPIVALFPGAFKPPHKGHVDVVNKLLKAADQVVVLVSPKTREGITADESVAVWNLYKDKGLFDGPVEIKISASPTPVRETYEVVENNPDNEFLVAFGKGEIDRYKTIEKFPNVKVFDAGEIEGVSATNLRMALAQKNEDEIKKSLPDGVSVDEFLQAINTKPEEKPAETPVEQPAPEEPLKESPPINFDESPYQDYVMQNQDKIEKAAAVFNLPIPDMNYAFDSGDEVVLNDDIWSKLENSKSYKMKTLDDAIQHALKLGINPKPYIDHIKAGKDIPLPLVLCYGQDKYYLVGGEVVLSLYRALGSIPTVLQGTLNLQTKQLHQPVDLGEGLIREYSVGLINKLIQKYQTEQPNLSTDDIKVAITGFEKIVTKLDPSKRDILKYKWDDLISTTAANQTTRIKAGKINKNNVDGDVNLIYNKDGIKVYKADSKKACIKYGNGYNFCISSRGKDNLYKDHRYGEERLAGLPYFIFDYNKSFDKDENGKFIDTQHLLVILVLEDGKWEITESDNEPNHMYTLSPEEAITKYPKLKPLKNILIYEPGKDKEELINKINNKYHVKSSLPWDWDIKNSTNQKYTLQFSRNDLYPDSNLDKLAKDVLQGTKHIYTVQYGPRKYDKYATIASNKDEIKYWDPSAKLTILENPINQQTKDYLEHLIKVFQEWRVELNKLNENKLNENKQHKTKLSPEQIKTIKTFLTFAVKELGLKQLPSKITLSYDTDAAKNQHSFGYFDPSNDKIWLYVKNRNMADLLRTLAHELVHRKQAEDGRIDYNSGNTGSDIENEANAQAGVLLRKFGKQNEEIYQ
jgi:cytidyltransferase-like protein